MTKTEMDRRLSTLSTKQVDQVRDLIAHGCGAQSIRFDTGLGLKYINAVFKLVELEVTK
ncbi:hypothetical protein [uncultured Roseibium sp.]|uniref:hypothetical protein n=1 Tax=uncultured Roseibium sp. TaxID=1936171 RepID=UPI00260415E8|nr:hypothetical protein [uncultured Roseibium sp.]